MFTKTKSTITIPLYGIKSRLYNPETDKEILSGSGDEIKRITFHAPINEVVTILTSHIIEIRKTKRHEENRKSHDGVLTHSQREIIVKIQTINNTYMVFAKSFDKENFNEISNEADLVVSEITAAIDESIIESNPFTNIKNQLEHRFNKLTDTI